jgi:hypothetical protein
MVTRLRMSLGLALGIALCVGATAATAHAQTSGSISAETSNTSQPMQTNWIGCVVFFHGKAHHCSLSGLQVPVTGVARISGMVNDVKDIADVAGTYKVVGVDDTFGGGHLKLKNDKGVSMTVWPFAASIEGSIDPNTVLQVGSNGMKIELKKK